MNTKISNQLILLRFSDIVRKSSMPLSIDELKERYIDTYITNDTRDEMRDHLPGNRVIGTYMATIMKHYSEENKENVSFIIKDKSAKGSRNIHEYYVDKSNILSEDEAELIYLSVYGSTMLDEKESADILKKLNPFVQEKYLMKRSDVYAQSGLAKSKNTRLTSNVKEIFHAIASDKYIELEYSKYNLNKELIPLNSGNYYVVRPIRITSTEGRLYLTAVDTKVDSVYDYQKIKNFRIDKITDIRIKDTGPKIGNWSEIKKMNPKKFTYMWTGKDTFITLRCKKNILDQVIERYDNVILSEDGKGDANYFEAKIKMATYQGVLYWCLQYSTALEILSPSNLRNELRDILKEAFLKHED